MKRNTTEMANITAAITAVDALVDAVCVLCGFDATQVTAIKIEDGKATKLTVEVAAPCIGEDSYPGWKPWTRTHTSEYAAGPFAVKVEREWLTTYVSVYRVRSAEPVAIEYGAWKPDGTRIASYDKLSDGAYVVVEDRRFEASIRPTWLVELAHTFPTAGVKQLCELDAATLANREPALSADEMADLIVDGKLPVTTAVSDDDIA